MTNYIQIEGYQFPPTPIHHPTPKKVGKKEPYQLNSMYNTVQEKEKDPSFMWSTFSISNLKNITESLDKHYTLFEVPLLSLFMSLAILTKKRERTKLKGWNVDPIHIYANPLISLSLPQGWNGVQTLNNFMLPIHYSDL